MYKNEAFSLEEQWCKLVYNNVFSRAGHIKEIRDEEHKHKVAGKYDAGNFGLLVVWMDQCAEHWL